MYSLLYSCCCYDPIGLPAFAAVHREGLLPERLVWRDNCPQVADENASPIEIFLVIELAAPIFEFPDCRRKRECAVSLIGPIYTPLVGLGIVGTHGHSFDVSGGGIRLQLVHIRTATPNRPGNDRRFELHPFVRTGERTQKAAVVRFPTAELEVEIVLA